MLYVATKPDSLFTALVDAALTGALSGADDSRRWRNWAHHVVEGFPNHEAPRTAILKLQSVHRKSTAYRMNHFFWVLLYDVLAAYAMRHNTHFSHKPHVHVDTGPLIGSYRCGPIQMPSIVATFWWDLRCFPDATLDRALIPPPSTHRACPRRPRALCVRRRRPSGDHTSEMGHQPGRRRVEHPRPHGATLPTLHRTRGLQRVVEPTRGGSTGHISCAKRDGFTPVRELAVSMAYEIFALLVARARNGILSTQDALDEFQRLTTETR